MSCLTHSFTSWTHTISRYIYIYTYIYFFYQYHILIFLFIQCTHTISQYFFLLIPYPILLFFLRYHYFINILDEWNSLRTWVLLRSTLIFVGQRQGLIHSYIYSKEMWWYCRSGGLPWISKYEFIVSL